MIFAFVPNVFDMLRNKSFYWKLGSLMGASWHVKGYELLEFLNKQSNLRKKRIYSVPGSYLAVILLFFSTSLSSLTLVGKNPLLMHLIRAVCREKNTS